MGAFYGLFFLRYGQQVWPVCQSVSWHWTLEIRQLFLKHLGLPNMVVLVVVHLVFPSNQPQRVCFEITTNPLELSLSMVAMAVHGWRTNELRARHHHHVEAAGGRGRDDLGRSHHALDKRNWCKLRYPPVPWSTLGNLDFYCWKPNRLLSQQMQGKPTHTCPKLLTACRPAHHPDDSKHTYSELGSRFHLL